MTASPTNRMNLARLGRLVRKELRESLRDRRTILTLVLMPLLLYPVLAMAFQQLILASRVEKQVTYRVAFASNEEAAAMLNYWEEGRRILLSRHGVPGAPRAKQPPADGEEQAEVPPYLEPLPRLAWVQDTNPEQLVRHGQADVAVRLSPEGLFRPDPRRPLAVDATLSYRKDSVGRDAVVYLERLTACRNAGQITRGLRLLEIPQRGDPVRVRAVEEPDETGVKTSLIPVLVPLVLILMTMTGAVYPAIDLTAGERERGTLEILVAAPIPRLSVLLAKYVAVVAVALLTALVNLGTMALTLKVTGIGAALLGDSLTLLTLVKILALLALFALFFSAVLLVLTSFARSFKEAQAYLIPLMLFCLMPGVLALMPGLGLSGLLSVVPLVNIVLLSRDVLEGTATAASSGVVVTTTLLYALGSIALAARVFGAEAVLSSESSGWGDLFRRSDSPRSGVAASTALLCLAMLFPVYFLTSSGLAQSGVDLNARLVIASVVNVLLFAGAPLLMMWWGRVPVKSGLGFAAPGIAGVMVAMLLGVSSWPLVHELIPLLRQAGFTTLREEHLERLQGAIGQWRMISPWLLVLTLAVIPAVVEELFFRGFLLRSLLEGGAKPVRAVVGSSVLFAVFHLLVSDALAIERLPPSLLLGLLLGCLAYRTGSIWPGVVLHLLHNGLVVLLGYYEPTLVEMGWLSAGQEHLPWWVLCAAGLGVTSGMVWLGIPRRKTVSETL